MRSSAVRGMASPPAAGIIQMRVSCLSSFSEVEADGVGDELRRPERFGDPAPRGTRTSRRRRRGVAKTLAAPRVMELLKARTTSKMAGRSFMRMIPPKNVRMNTNAASVARLRSRRPADAGVNALGRAAEASARASRLRSSPKVDVAQKNFRFDSCIFFLHARTETCILQKVHLLCSIWIARCAFRRTREKN